MFYFVLEKQVLYKATNEVLLNVVLSLYFQNPLELQFHRAQFCLHPNSTNVGEKFSSHPTSENVSNMSMETSLCPFFRTFCQ